MYPGTGKHGNPTVNSVMAGIGPSTMECTEFNPRSKWRGGMPIWGFRYTGMRDVCVPTPFELLPERTGSNREINVGRQNFEMSSEGLSGPEDVGTSVCNHLDALKQAAMLREHAERSLSSKSDYGVKCSSFRQMDNAGFNKPEPNCYQSRIPKLKHRLIGDLTAVNNTFRTQDVGVVPVVAVYNRKRIGLSRQSFM